MNQKKFLLLTALSFSCIFHASGKPITKKRKLCINTFQDSLKAVQVEKAEKYALHKKSIKDIESTKVFDNIQQTRAYQQTIPAQTRVLKCKDLVCCIVQFIPTIEIEDSLLVAVIKNNLITSKKDCSLLKFYGDAQTPPDNYIKNTKASNNNTLLHKAVAIQQNFTNPTLQKLYFEKKLCITKILLAHGCDVHAKNDEGDMPIHTAANFNNIEAIKLLHQAGADLNAKNNNDENSICMALEGIAVDIDNDSFNLDRSIATIETLIYLEADVLHAKGNSNKTPLQFWLDKIPAYGKHPNCNSMNKITKVLKNLGAKEN
jgi:Ankyrin repeats (many copies)